MARPVLMVLVAVLQVAPTVVWADTRNDKAAQELVARFRSGDVKPAELVNRTRYLGAEAWVSGQLVEALGSEKDRERFIEPLSELIGPQKGAPQQVLMLLDDPEIRVVMAALRALGRMKAINGREPVVAKLGDARVGVRREAAKALGQIADKRSTPALIAAIKVEQDLPTRVELLLALGRHKDPKAAKTLEGFLSDDSEATRLAAVQALCLAGNARGLAEAKKLFSAADEYKRLQAIDMFEGVDAKTALALKELLADPSHKVRARAARVMAEAGNADMTLWLLKASAATEGAEVLAYENEIEKLHLTDVQRKALLKQGR